MCSVAMISTPSLGGWQFHPTLSLSMVAEIRTWGSWWAWTRGVCYLSVVYNYTRARGGLLTGCYLPQATASNREPRTLFYFTSLHYSLQYTSSPHLAIQQSKLQKQCKRT